MKICTHKGVALAVLTRNEHCPPHVHAGASSRYARFEFAFWHNGVRLWDVSPAQKRPTERVLEELRQMLKMPANLRKARELWWSSRQTVCLENQHWDPGSGEIVRPKTGLTGTLAIRAARFDTLRYRTLLQLDHQSRFMEFEL